MGPTYCQGPGGTTQELWVPLCRNAVSLCARVNVAQEWHDVLMYVSREHREQQLATASELVSAILSVCSSNPIYSSGLDSSSPIRTNCC